jgi:long-chain acyl-CoA synthetase
MKHWLKSYDSDVPHDINADAYPSVVDMFETAAQKYADHTALTCFGMHMTYADLDAKSRAFAAYLQTELGINKGDRIALMCPNIFAFPVAMFGILRAGACQVNVNPLYTPRELEHQLIDSGAETIVIFSGSTPVLAEIVDNTPIKTVVTIDLGDGIGAPIPSPAVDARLQNTTAMADALTRGGDMTYTPAGLTGEDLLYFQYTGGTTGPSKGAVLKHKNVVANVEQYKTFLPKACVATQEVMVGALPLYHIFGLTLCLAYASLGCRLVLIPNPRDADAFIAAIKTEGVTIFPAVNTLFAGLAMHPAMKEVDFSKLKLSIGGGAAIIETVSNNWRALTGQHITEGYGLSETSPLVSIVPFDVEEFTGSCGLPVSSTDVILLDDNDTVVPIGERGEICVSGPQVMTGYWNKDEANASAFTKDGYFRTGDIGAFDEQGYLRIVDRKKDMIIVSGFNVFPNEVEAVVTAIDGVAECACIGVPDEKTGEAVRVFVVKKPGSEVSEDNIIAHCREEMTAYKTPRQITFIDELPKSSVGKILRRELRNV